MINSNEQEEQRIKQLQERIKALEVTKQFEADQALVQAVQTEMLTTLRTIRAEIASSSGNDNSASSKELQALKDENENLKKITTKQAYRINHLIKGMEEMQEKIKS